MDSAEPPCAVRGSLTLWMSPRVRPFMGFLTIKTFGCSSVSPSAGTKYRTYVLGLAAAIQCPRNLKRNLDDSKQPPLFDALLQLLLRIQCELQRNASL